MHLYSLLYSEAWTDLLDVLEMVCIEVETALINTDPAHEAEVLANHKMAKAAWQIFTHMQQKITAEATIYARSIERTPPVPALSPLEQLTENILDPTRQSPEMDDLTN
jgi:hypothetical protein